MEPSGGVAARLAGAAGGLPGPHTVLADRDDATVVRVGEAVVKLHPAGSDAAALRARLRVAAHPLTRGIWLPPLETRLGALDGRPVTRWPYGEPVDPADRDAAPWPAAGDLLARLHAVPVEALPGPLPAMRGPAKAARAVARLTGLPDSPAVRAVRRAWQRLPPWARDEVPHPGPATLCHGDWHLGQLVRARARIGAAPAEQTVSAPAARPASAPAAPDGGAGDRDALPGALAAIDGPPADGRASGPAARPASAPAASYGSADGIPGTPDRASVRPPRHATPPYDRAAGRWLLIDVDDLGLGDPAWDLARPAMWFGAGLLAAGEWAAFLGAYRAAGGVAVAADGDPWERLDVPARALAVQTAAIALAKAARDDRALDEAESAVVATCARIAQLQ